MVTAFVAGLGGITLLLTYQDSKTLRTAWEWPPAGLRAPSWRPQSPRRRAKFWPPRVAPAIADRLPTEEDDA